MDPERISFLVLVSAPMVDVPLAHFQHHAEANRYAERVRRMQGPEFLNLIEPVMHCIGGDASEFYGLGVYRLGESPVDFVNESFFSFLDEDGEELDSLEAVFLLGSRHPLPQETPNVEDVDLTTGD